MNKRIRELMIEAGYAAPELAGRANKLVELIVKECLNQCYNRGMNDELYDGQLKAAAYIEEYFGVTE